MRAILRNYRQSPRKVRLVANLIRGKTVEEAFVLLPQTVKRAAPPLLKLIKSAAANAKQNQGARSDQLVIKSLRVNSGSTLHRWRPAWRGMAHPIRKRTSHISVELEVQQKKPNSKNQK